MPQQVTQDKAMTNRLLAEVENINALFDEIHRAGLIVSLNAPTIELPDKVKTLRLIVQVLRPVG